MSSNEATTSTDYGDATYAVGATVLSIAAITTGLRFYTRRFTNMGVGIDDWFVLAAMLLALATVALLIWADSTYPEGTQATQITDPNYVFTDSDITYFRAFFAVGILYYSITGATKIGVMLMYHRVFSASTTFRVQLLAVGFLTVAWWLSINIALLAACTPFESRWGHGASDPDVCINVNIMWLASGMIEVFLDLLILAMPLSVIYRLHMSRGRKISLAGIFLLGGFTVGTGFARAYLGYVPGSMEPDYANTELWATLHTGTGIICASLPVFAPLVNKIAASPWGSWIGSRLSSLSVRSIWSSIGGRDSRKNESMELYGHPSIATHPYHNTSSQAIIQQKHSNVETVS